MVPTSQKDINKFLKPPRPNRRRINAPVTLNETTMNWIPMTLPPLISCYGDDHGKSRFLFASKVVLKMNDVKYYVDVFGLADAACKKGNDMISDKTCMPELVKGINVTGMSDLVFTADGDSKLAIDLTKSGLLQCCHLPKH